MKTDPRHFPNLFFYGWLAILAWAPLPAASNSPWAVALLVFLGSLLISGFIVFCVIRKVPVPGLLKPYTLPVLLLLVIPLWSSLQCLSLPLTFLEGLSPAASDAYHLAGQTEGRLTLDIARTRLLALFSWLLWGYFCLGLLLLDSRKRIELVCFFIVCCGVVQALYGSFMTLSGLEYGFFVEKEAYRGVATGTFINRNHLAGYLEMSLAVGIGLLVASLSGKRHSNWRSRMRGFLDAMLGAKVRLRIFLALMVIALVLTHSRMGNTAFFTSLLICGCLWMLFERKLHKGAIILFTSLVLIDTLIVGQWFGFEEVVERLENTSAESESRDEVVSDTLVMAKDFWVTGSGLGSYGNAFPKYQQDTVTGFLTYYDHAHNDYLEFFVELGLVGFVPLALLVLVTLGRALWTMGKRRDRFARGVGFASAMGIIALLIHSTVDFNLQMPANALLFIVILILGWVSMTLRHEDPY